MFCTLFKIIWIWLGYECLHRNMFFRFQYENHTFVWSVLPMPCIIITKTCLIFLYASCNHFIRNDSALLVYVSLDFFTSKLQDLFIHFVFSFRGCSEQSCSQSSLILCFIVFQLLNLLTLNRILYYGTYTFLHLSQDVFSHLNTCW